MQNLFRLFKTFLRAPAPVSRTLFVEAFLIIVVYLSIKAHLPPSFPLAPLTVTLVFISAWRAHYSMPERLERLRSAAEPLSPKGQRRLLLGLGLLPIAVLVLTADPLWAQRLFTFELAVAILPTALWLYAPKWKLLQGWLARLGAPLRRRNAEAYVSYGVAAILANEIAIRSLSESDWVGFRAAAPLILQTLVLTTLVLGEHHDDEDGE